MPARDQPDHDAIQRRAYELYVARGRRAGHALRDWLDAKADVEARERAGLHTGPAPDVARDKVAEASWESFPASDAPAWR